MRAKSRQSCPTLCDPTDCSPSGSSVEFSRPEYWGGLPCPPPGDIPDPGIEPVSLMSPALAAAAAKLLSRVRLPGAPWAAARRVRGVFQAGALGWAATAFSACTGGQVLSHQRHLGIHAAVLIYSLQKYRR